MAITAIMNIIGGLVLCAGIIGALPVLGGFLEKAGKFLGGFQVIIGIIMMILGLLGIFSLQGIVAFLVGVILLTGAFHVIPALGAYLEKFGTWLGGFQTIIGVIAIIIGVLGLL
ncbi:hypothetical protein MBOURGENBZM_20800 [Methanoculleus bourgensis]|uniref:Uncharacterized protein n=1 Tax=Methanoculleus bourgensis TaxID=83986 RepID=A0A110BIH9_9EURY|nr:hypothetical protein [Methanoculleus bourgensis]GLI47288.1 hypothetical protein MBOURGENBZM_20800 [Methanoculleus bourgensis]CVK34430.1 conserved membrane protein of unknown function [Methanoculleus bourgensis]